MHRQDCHILPDTVREYNRTCLLYKAARRKVRKPWGLRTHKKTDLRPEPQEPVPVPDNH